MIPYEELVTALARWRARQGLPTGPGDYLGEPAPASYNYAPPAGQAAAGAARGADLDALSADMLEEEESSPASQPDIFSSEPVGGIGDDTQDQAIDPYGYQPPPPQDDIPTTPPKPA